MRFYAKMLAIGLAMFMSIGSAMAQDAATTGSATGGPGSGRGGRGGGLYAVALAVSGLTDEQKATLTKQQEEARTKMQEMRKNAEGGGGFDREAYRKVQEEQKAAIEKVLTDDQKKEFEAKASEMRGRGGRGGQSTGTAEKKSE